MREVVFLGQSHVSSLEELLISQKHEQTDRLKRNIPFFIANNGTALAVGLVVNRSSVEEALLTFFQRPNAHHDYLAVTTVATKSFELNPELFNMLCASCSSATPLVICHLVICPKKLLPVFKKAWQSSRLGKFTVGTKDLSQDEAVEMLEGMANIDHQLQATLYSIQYPQEAPPPPLDSVSVSAQQPRKSMRPRCRYC